MVRISILLLFPGENSLIYIQRRLPSASNLLFWALPPLPCRPRCEGGADADVSSRPRPPPGTSLAWPSDPGYSSAGVSCGWGWGALFRPSCSPRGSPRTRPSPGTLALHSVPAPSTGPCTQGGLAFPLASVRPRVRAASLHP